MILRKRKRGSLLATCILLLMILPPVVVVLPGNGTASMTGEIRTQSTVVVSSDKTETFKIDDPGAGYYEISLEQCSGLVDLAIGRIEGGKEPTLVGEILWEETNVGSGSYVWISDTDELCGLEISTDSEEPDSLGLIIKYDHTPYCYFVHPTYYPAMAMLCCLLPIFIIGVVLVVLIVIIVKIVKGKKK